MYQNRGYHFQKIYCIILIMKSQKTGWLIVNHFLHTNKFSEIYSWLLTAATKAGCQLLLKTNAELLCSITDHTLLEASSSIRPDFVLFWDKDIRLARFLEHLGLRLFNCADAIALCDDKSLTFTALSHSNEMSPHDNIHSPFIPMPKTILAPMTYSNIGYSHDFSFLDQVISVLHFPLIVKECFGSFGAQVYLAHSEQELSTILNHCDSRPIIFQEFIKSSFGRDLRLQVVGNEVIATMLRTHASDFRANITNGGTMLNYEPSEAACNLALHVCRSLKLDFAGVDLLFGEHDEPILCEVNSNAHFKNIHTCTTVNAAEKIIEMILQKLEMEKQ